MHEVAATLFTFPMVLRDSNTPEGGFPPGSQDLTTLLCGETTIKGNNISNAPVVARLRTASVLLATAKTCAEWLEEDERNGSPKRLNTPQGWRDELYGNEQSAYDKFYAQVQKTVENASVVALVCYLIPTKLTLCFLLSFVDADIVGS